MTGQFKQFNAEEYAAFQRNLLKKKGSGMQRAFINAAKENKRFVYYVREKVSTDGIKEIPIISEPLSESEYKDCPIDTEVKLYDTLANITPETACRVSFWGEVTLEHIEGSDEGENQRRIQAYYLAANGGTMPGGLARIDKALSDQGSEKDIDGCVRTILRRLSGVYERGNRTQYVDCPFGRAWWRIRLSNEIAGSSGMPVHSIRQLLHETQTYWEKLVDLVVSRNSILGDQKVRDALIWTLAEIRVNEGKDNKMLKTDSLVVLNRLLGIRCAWQELGILDLSEIKQLIVGEIRSLT